MLSGDRATLVGRPYPGNEVLVLAAWHRRISLQSFWVARVSRCLVKAFQQERGGTSRQKDEEVGEIVQGGVQVGIGTSANLRIVWSCVV